MSGGSPITFSIYDATTGQEHVAEVKDPVTGQWVKTFPFTAGNDVTLDLRSTGIIPMAINSLIISSFFLRAEFLILYYQKKYTDLLIIF